VSGDTIVVPNYELFTHPVTIHAKETAAAGDEETKPAPPE
jgi:hypothetical protein